MNMMSMYCSSSVLHSSYWENLISQAECNQCNDFPHPVGKQIKNDKNQQTFLLLLLGDIGHDVVYVIRHDVALLTLWNIKTSHITKGDNPMSPLVTFSASRRRRSLSWSFLYLNPPTHTRTDRRAITNATGSKVWAVQADGSSPLLYAPRVALI